MEWIKSLSKKIKGKALILVLTFFATPMAAQTTNSGVSQEVVFYTMVGLVLIVALLVLIIAIYLLQILKAVLQKEMSPEALAKIEAAPSWWAKTWDKWNDLRPMEEEENIMLDHNYDGIKELDNHLPPWWKALFYGSIVYAVVYLLIFHVFKTAPLQEEKYEMEMAAAAAIRVNQTATVIVDFDENDVTFNDDGAALIAGKDFFESQCAICHKADGGGLAGPNLTDEYWKHGGSMTDIYTVLKKGVQGTAMIPWESKLNPNKLREVASYVKSLQGTNPVGGLPPDGTLFVEPKEGDDNN
jgi:cytochrome c oxidase cbb3-type subunit 3